MKQLKVFAVVARLSGAAFSPVNVALASAVSSPVAFAQTSGTTPIATVTTSINFSQLTTDLTAFLVAVLGIFLVRAAFHMGMNWIGRIVK